MCGIAGLYRYADPGPVCAMDLTRMADALAHRGPDDEGIWTAGPVGLAHRRLSIIDLKGGHQPMSNEDDSVWIVFNGEIYNHRELRAALEGRGHRYKTDSDTETILHAYEEYGDRCVERLRGMFAFAVWDRRADRLLLARDRLGIKPLYYTFDGGRLLFASEIKALLPLRASAPSLDEESLDCFLGLGYVPAPWTLFRDVVKLPAGHVMTVTEGRVRLWSYWDLRYEEKWTAPARELEEELDARLTEAVASHLMSEVPLGLFLSGGLDSGFLAACMTQRLRVPCHTFSIGYDGALPENELVEAKNVAERFGARHHEYRIGPQAIGRELPAVLWQLEEPIGSSASVPLFFLARAAREHVTVVLSGEGADELLGGYGLYRTMLLAERCHRVPPLRALCARLAGLAGDTKPGRMLRAVARPLEERYRGIATAFEPEQTWPRWGTASGGGSRLAQTLADHHGRSRGAHPLDRMLYFDTKVWLADDLLLKADKMTMAASMELRVPFLDHEVVEFCARLPVELKVDGTESKVLLRRLLGRVFPPEFLRRRKKGFPVPLARWFRDSLHRGVRDALLDAGSLSRRLVRADVLDALLRRAGGPEGRPEGATEAEARRLWALYQIELWRAVFRVRTP